VRAIFIRPETNKNEPAGNGEDTPKRPEDPQGFPATATT
jgi:hypothetical protein